MSVVTGDNGAVIFGVPTTGGPIVGYSIDAQGKMSTSGQTISAGTFTRVAATHIGGRYVVAAVAGDSTIMTLVSDNLGDSRMIGKLQGGLVSANPLVMTRDGQVTATGGNTEVTLAKFDSAWNQIGSERIADGTMRGMDAIPYGADALVAWTTQDSCMVQSVGIAKFAINAGNCLNPRLAYSAGDRAELAYTRTEGVYVGDVYMSGYNAIASTHFIAPRATSPRIAYDGQRYWMTYIDDRGGVVVGFLTEDMGTLVSMALEDAMPGADAYDLKIVDGQPVVYSADANGYSAHTICVAQH